jgi:hypothetical protein
VDLPDTDITAPEAMALPAGMLPGAEEAAGIVPAAPPANALLAWMHVESGRILRRAGRTNDAGAAYTAALQLARRDVRPYDSYSRDEKAALAEAPEAVPARLLPRFDMAVTLAQEGAIACGAIRSAQQIYQAEQDARERQYRAAGDIDREFARRSLELNAELAQKRRAIDRFDRAGLQALQADYNRRLQELQAWRDGELKKLQEAGAR